MLQLKHPAFPVYVCTSVYTQLPCREINWLEGEEGAKETRGERLPEGGVKLIPVLQFWSYLEKNWCMCLCYRTDLSSAQQGICHFSKHTSAQWSRAGVSLMVIDTNKWKTQTKPASARVKYTCNPALPRCKDIF